MCKLKGPSLVDVCRSLLDKSSYTNDSFSKEFGVGQSWLSDFLNKRKQHPNPIVLQRVYEELTGEALLGRDQLKGTKTDSPPQEED